MLRQLAFGVIGLICVGAAIWLMGVKDLFLDAPIKEEGKTHLEQIARQLGDQTGQSVAADSLDEKNTPQQALDLALEGIDLVQGEGGFEIWRLKASWGNIRKEDGLIIVDAPSLHYFLHDDKKEDDELTVRALSGEIDQSKHIIRFINNVVMVNGPNTLMAELLVYYGADKKMTVPVANTFTGADFSGSADSAIWYMEKKIIEATGNVVVHLQSTNAQAL